MAEVTFDHEDVGCPVDDLVDRRSQSPHRMSGRRIAPLRLRAQAGEVPERQLADVEIGDRRHPCQQAT